MKKLLWLLLLIPLMGCMTANQLEAEKAYYQMLTIKQAQTSPLVRLDVADPTKPINLKTIEVFAPPSNTPIAQYQQKDYVQPWLNVLSMAVPWLGVYGVTSAVVSGMKDMGGTTYNQSGTGNKMVGGNLADSTSVPTVVTQPAPIIVNPVIVP
jgi:hypothetical protein